MLIDSTLSVSESEVDFDFFLLVTMEVRDAKNEGFLLRVPAEGCVEEEGRLGSDMG